MSVSVIGVPRIVRWRAEGSGDCEGSFSMLVSGRWGWVALHLFLTCWYKNDKGINASFLH